MTQTLAPAYDVGAARRWAMLAASTLAQAAAAVMIHGPAFLIPALHAQGMSLGEAGVVAAASTVGVMVALVAWGWVTDRRGERFVLLTGLSATVVAGVAGAVSGGTPLLVVTLFLAGAAAASTNAASGRVVVGWFPPARRGLAMGIRQMSQPIGVGVAAVSVAVVADSAGAHAALWVPVVACVLAALLVAAVVIDPPRPDARTPEATANPYRQDSYLARIHGVSVLLVAPQFLVWSFALVWLVQERDWSPAAAGTLIASAQIAGALGRLGVGHLSDLVGSRLRPLRWVAAAATATLALLALTAAFDLALAGLLVVAATVVTVADNGLAFTAIAERAGPFWSGRALGAQNTAQFLSGSAVVPLAGLAVTHVGYAATFALAAALPAIAAPLVPVREERELS
ncbi:MFS transporter [Nocardioides sp. SR21]|uniref:MFS transporter n=1 Tax=Nocardioides sp. SR21 TaxID=2919501 RepID=UPI001FA9F941|nr:MFS transporter [Nocardioides sp. SR21]